MRPSPILLEPSRHAVDRGTMIGRDPREIPGADWERAGTVRRGVMKAVRVKCLDCCGGAPAEVRKCVSTGCARWPFRTGKDVFRGRRSPEAMQGA